MTPPRALLLDFDGVIADTQNVHIASWQRTFALFGWEIADEVCSRAVEVDDRAFLQEVFTARGIEQGDVEGWVRRKQALAVTLLADAPRVYPGVPELVRRVRGNVRLAVVSTTWRENIEVVLRASALADAFDAIISKEDVAAVKPDPECYRLALERLMVTARDAVALEDSATGLAAARGAGLRTLAVGHRLGPGDWVGESDYLADLRNTSVVLAKLGMLS